MCAHALVVRLSGFIITPHVTATRLPRPRGCIVEILDGTNFPLSPIFPALCSFLLVKGLCVSPPQRLPGFIHVLLHWSNPIWRIIYSCMFFSSIYSFYYYFLLICPGRIFLLSFYYLHYSFLPFKNLFLLLLLPLPSHALAQVLQVLGTAPFDPSCHIIPFTYHSMSHQSTDSSFQQNLSFVSYFSLIFLDPKSRSFGLFSSLRWPHTRQGQVY